MRLVMLGNTNIVAFTVKVIQISLVMCVAIGAVGSVNAENSPRLVKIGGKVYSVNRIRDHLTKAFYADGKAELSYLWSEDDGQRPRKYALHVSDELSKYEEELRESIANSFEHLAGLTGVRFEHVGPQEKKIEVLFTFTESFSELKGFGFIHEAGSPGGAKIEYAEALRLTRKINSHRSIDVRELESGKEVFGLAWMGYILDEEQQQAIDKYDYVKSLSGARVVSLLMGFSRYSRIVKESNGNGYYFDAPYIWPFDEAVLKALYARPELSGKPSLKVIDLIVEDLANQYQWNGE